MFRMLCNILYPFQGEQNSLRSDATYLPLSSFSFYLRNVKMSFHFFFSIWMYIFIWEYIPFHYYWAFNCILHAIKEKFVKFELRNYLVIYYLLTSLNSIKVNFLKLRNVARVLNRKWYSKSLISRVYKILIIPFNQEKCSPIIMFLS